MQTSKKGIDTDRFMVRLFNCLKTDFRSVHSDIADGLDVSDILTYRQTIQPTYWHAPVTYFKRRYQLESLFKRYRFANDLFTDKELEARTIAKFLETQNRIAVKKNVTHRAFLVLQKARSIVKEILGSYDEEEHFQACKFGSKADVGCPAASAYLDIKLQVAKISGSSEHREWFRKNYLQTDDILSDILEQRIVPYSEEYDDDTTMGCTESLKLVAVPKKFNIKRSIMPNTRIGSFFTLGLGKVIEKRLTKIGLNIKRLQRLHRLLAKRYSNTRTHVTADLSAASDSFVWELIARLVPRKWLHILAKGRLTNVTIDSKVYKLESFMTMGIGFTFPLQTLLFYSIIKAIMELSGVQGRVSVYGDDLIYPRRIHHFVSQIFTDIGFLLNDDKTFVHHYFRESCGGDYYCGVDVRPFQPEGEFQMLSPKPYAVLVYKTINGLLRRWSPEEIPITLNFLYQEVVGHLGVLHQVPPSFPDHSGVKVCSPNWNLPWYQPWVKVTRDGNKSYCFAFLSIQPRDRVVLAQYAYYWEKLRSMGEPIDYNPYGTNDPYTYLRQMSNSSPNLCEDYTAPTEMIRWVKCKHQPKNYRSKLNGKRLLKREPVVALKQDPGRVIYQSSVVPSWD